MFKNDIKKVIASIIALIIFNMVFVCSTSNSTSSSAYRKTFAKFTEFDRLVIALITIESTNNDNAIMRRTNSVGCLQLRKIYVDQVNKILGYKKYTYRDRLNRKKSIEMFKIYQQHFNPHKNLKRAITLHNPGAGKNYYKSVMREFKNN